VTAIVVWLAAFLTSMTPHLPREYADGRTPTDAEQLAISARFEVAQEIADVAYANEEPPLYRGEYGRARTAALLASVFIFESRLSPRIRAGHCGPQECDSGRAVGVAQLWPGKHGMRLTSTGYRYCTADENVSFCDGPADLVAHEAKAVRYALRILRARGLSSYLGEGFDGPATKLRRDTAARWMAERQPPLTDAEVARAELAAAQ